MNLITQEESFEIAKNHLADYLEKKGINTRKNFHCLSGTHEDKNPSMGLFNKGKCVHCFSCGVNLDIFDLIGLDYGTDSLAKQYEIACDMYGIGGVNVSDTDVILMGDKREHDKILANIEANRKQKVDKSSYFDKSLARLKDTDYLSSRGISQETAEKYGIGYDPNFSESTGSYGWQAIIIPTSANSYVARNINPNATPKNRYRAYGVRQPFNLDVLKGDDDVIIIVEGEFDTLSCLEEGFPAIGLGGKNNQRKLIEAIKKANNDKLFIIAMDNDKPKADGEIPAGEEASRALAIELSNNGISYYEDLDIYGKYKDANEFLIKDRNGFKKALEESFKKAKEVRGKEKEERLQEYRQIYSDYSHIEEFFKSTLENNNPIPTGYKSLDKKMGGGLYPGLYVLGGETAAGKTTFALNLMDQIADKENKDVLIFSLEMGRNELIGKSISRLTAIWSLENMANVEAFGRTYREVTTRNNQKTGHKLTNDEIEIIEKSAMEYSKIADKVFTVEGGGYVGTKEIREQVESHIRITERRPVVLVDYLQIISTQDPRVSDKQKIDQAVTDLKIISRDFKIPILAISSLNRQAYRGSENKKKIDLTAFKESGGIEYGSDMVLALRSDDLPDDDSNKSYPITRKVKIEILKSRHGKSGIEEEFTYYPAYNLYEEGWSDLNY